MPESTRMMSLVSAPGVMSTIVGVIDLKQGDAVHAVAGNRSDYQPVPFCNGSATELIDHYASLGVTRFYVADLDAIQHGRPQTKRLISVTERIQQHHSASQTSDTELLIDLGWRDQTSDRFKNAMAHLNSINDRCRWVAATETMSQIASLAELASEVSAKRIVLSLDYRQGVLQVANPGSSNTSQPDWMDQAAELGIGGYLILDLAAVGCGGGTMTAAKCREIREAIGDEERNRHAQIYSGGGIRNAADVQTLRASGCNSVLVATALHGI